ncbi:MAG: ATP-binding protein [Steroidobacteraceae bacterium]
MRPPTPSPSSPTTTTATAVAAVTTLSVEELKQRLRQLGLYGLLAHAEELLNEPWIGRLLEIEESERRRRSLKRRLDSARLGTFKPMADFDYQWPKELDRLLLDELFTLDFLEHAANIVIVGPNGLGKSMVAKNLLHQAVLRGHTARFIAASDMLHDLAAQDSSTQLARRLRRYTTPALLCCDSCSQVSNVDWVSASASAHANPPKVLHINHLRWCSVSPSVVSSWTRSCYTRCFHGPAGSTRARALGVN